MQPIFGHGLFVLADQRRRGPVGSDVESTVLNRWTNQCHRAVLRMRNGLHHAAIQRLRMGEYSLHVVDGRAWNLGFPKPRDDVGNGEAEHFCIEDKVEFVTILHARRQIDEAWVRSYVVSADHLQESLKQV